MFFTISVTARLKSTTFPRLCLPLTKPTQRGLFLLRRLRLFWFENMDTPRHLLFAQLACLRDATPRSIRESHAPLRDVATGSVMLHRLFKHAVPWLVTWNVHLPLYYLRVFFLIGIGELAPGFLLVFFFAGETGGDVRINLPLMLICWRNVCIPILRFIYCTAKATLFLFARLG